MFAACPSYHQRKKFVSLFVIILYYFLITYLVTSSLFPLWTEDPKFCSQPGLWGAWTRVSQQTPKELGGPEKERSCNKPMDLQIKTQILPLSEVSLRKFMPPLCVHLQHDWVGRALCSPLDVCKSLHCLLFAAAKWFWWSSPPLVKLVRWAEHSVAAPRWTHLPWNQRTDDISGNKRLTMAYQLTMALPTSVMSLCTTLENILNREQREAVSEQERVSSTAMLVLV